MKWRNPRCIRAAMWMEDGAKYKCTIQQKPPCVCPTEKGPQSWPAAAPHRATTRRRLQTSSRTGQSSWDRSSPKYVDQYNEHREHDVLEFFRKKTLHFFSRITSSTQNTSDLEKSRLNRNNSICVRHSTVACNRNLFLFGPARAAADSRQLQLRACLL